jgi:hypothetical protein
MTIGLQDQKVWCHQAWQSQVSGQGFQVWVHGIDSWGAISVGVEGSQACHYTPRWVILKWKYGIELARRHPDIRASSVILQILLGLRVDWGEPLHSTLQMQRQRGVRTFWVPSQLAVNEASEERIGNSFEYVLENLWMRDLQTSLSISFQGL